MTYIFSCLLELASIIQKLNDEFIVTIKLQNNISQVYVDPFCAVAVDPIPHVFPPVCRDSLDRGNLPPALVLVQVLGRTGRAYGHRARVQR